MSEPAAGNPASTQVGGHSQAAEHYDPITGKIGMWVFLFTELLLFGTLFICYGVYLNKFSWQFAEGAHELDIPTGTINTLILLTSSLSMALSIAALQRSKKKLSIWLLNFTILCALAFLIIKAMEWGAKFEHGIYPGSKHLLQDLTHGENVFFGLYFTMTGLHALHVIIGMVVLAVARRKVRREEVTGERIVFLENSGLYWHLVDLVWIYLFPLFYLIG